MTAVNSPGVDLESCHRCGLPRKPHRCSLKCFLSSSRDGRFVNEDYSSPNTA